MASEHYAARTRPVEDRLADRAAVVSGGASGIGRATCMRLAAEGASVIVADINCEAGAAVAAGIGEGAVFHPLDVSDRSAWKAVTEKALSLFGHLDILVNSAGILAGGTVESTSPGEWRRMLDINLKGTFFGCQAAVAAMKERGGGAIVNLSSIAGIRGSPDLFAYDASKGAVRALTKEVAVYCARQGYAIRCNSVHPAAVRTPMVRDFFAGRPDDGRMTLEGWVGSQAIQRVGEPEEIAALIAWLVSDESSFSTGAEFVIDGGATAGAGRRPPVAPNPQGGASPPDLSAQQQEN